MKVLIYFDKNLLEPIGGPTGYLYNLHKEVLKENVNFIDFLDNKKAKRKMFVKKIYKKLPKSIQKKYKDSKRNRNKYNIIDMVFSNSHKNAICDLNKYDVVHFHNTLDMYMAKDSLESYNGKVIITSHSPKAFFKEIIEDRLSKEEYLKRKDELDKLEIMDEYAFNKAHYIMFPCEEAEEPYYNSWEKYADIKKRNIDKYIYIPTGILPIEVNQSKEEIRKRYNIPQDAFVISYVGRHNVVKGYDQLKIIGEKILEKYANAYFLNAGTEKPLSGLNNKRWIEVGWTDKPYEIINASDLFILPNKETYFDLILLEVLSIGKAVLLTSTGGNKYFKQFSESGLFYYNYDDIDQALKQFDLIYNSNTKELGSKNKKMFMNNFTIDIFTKKYVEVLKGIYKKEDKK